MTTQETYLVTGALGCIGAWTLYHLVQQGKHAVSFDLSENRSRLDLLLPRTEQDAIRFVKGDLTDTRQVVDVIAREQVTHIIHLAALQVPFCRADPVLGAQVNVVGTVNVFEAAQRAGVKHLAQASSIAVYGAPDEYPAGPITHDARPNPHTIYGVYKVACEGVARVYWQDYGVSSVGLRPYVVYGAGRDQGMTSEPTMAIRAAACGEAFQISFSGTMQFQYASDVARQFIDAARSPLDGAHTFSLGGTATSVEQFVATLRRLRPDARITVADNPLAFPAAFDDLALRSHVPVIYATPLEDGIRQTLQIFQQTGAMDAQ